MDTDPQRNAHVYEKHISRRPKSVFLPKSPGYLQEMCKIRASSPCFSKGNRPVPDKNEWIPWSICRHFPRGSEFLLHRMFKEGRLMKLVTIRPEVTDGREIPWSSRIADYSLYNWNIVWMPAKYDGNRFGTSSEPIWMTCIGTERHILLQQRTTTNGSVVTYLTIVKSTKPDRNQSEFHQQLEKVIKRNISH